MLTSMPVPPPEAPRGIQEHEEKIEILRQRLSALEGKEHKRERQLVHKAIRNLEMNDEYVEVMKSIRECERSQAMRHDLQDTAVKLRREEISKAAMLAAMSREREARQAKASEEQAKHELELAAAKQAKFDENLEIHHIRKGDGSTKPRIGNMVGISYTAHFAEAIEYQGEVFQGQFDSSVVKDPKTGRKVEHPLVFRIGDAKVVRGLEECLLTMSLGERVGVTISAAWGYKKGGVQDENGRYTIPPGAKLLYDVTLMSVNHREFKKEPKSPRSPRSSNGASPRFGPTTPPRSPRSSGPHSPMHSPVVAPTGGGMASPNSPLSPAGKATWPKAPPKLTL